MAETPHPQQESKADLRRALLQARADLPRAARDASDASIMRNLQAWLARHPAVLLGVYWPIRHEPDLRKLYDALHARGVRLALPAMDGAGAPLRFAAWAPGDAVQRDRWGIATPRTLAFVQPDTLCVPCVGFTAGGFRLGYGGGFYDRTLAAAPRPRTIGVAREADRVDFAPGPHDIALDVVITERALE